MNMHMQTVYEEKNLNQDVWLDSIKHRKVDVGMIVASILLGIILDWTSIEILIFAVFVWSIVWSIPSRLLAMPALFFLVCVPFLLLINREVRAEEFAVYAYYFLVMAVIRGIIEVRSEENVF